MKNDSQLRELYQNTVDKISESFACSSMCMNCEQSLQRGTLKGHILFIRWMPA